MGAVDEDYEEKGLSLDTDLAPEAGNLSNGMKAL